MKDKPFCSPENLSVIIPYKDFEKLVSVATNYDGLSAKVSQLEKQLEALRGMYFEAIEKIGEINRLI